MAGSGQIFETGILLIQIMKSAKKCQSQLKKINRALLKVIISGWAFKLAFIIHVTQIMKQVNRYNAQSNKWLKTILGSLLKIFEH